MRIYHLYTKRIYTYTHNTKQPTKEPINETF
nr:MAG TPA: hypothetical protein [Caudoviricetes sp.]